MVVILFYTFVLIYMDKYVFTYTERGPNNMQAVEVIPTGDQTTF